jgi:hypothetical protein
MKEEERENDFIESSKIDFFKERPRGFLKGEKGGEGDEKDFLSSARI